MNELFTLSQHDWTDHRAIRACVAIRHDSSQLDAMSREDLMRRRAKDFIEISDHTSLDMLIQTLVAIRDNLDEQANPELKMRGDDVFGRRLSISYFREISEEESSIEARYQAAHYAADALEIERLQRKLDEIPSRREFLRRAA